MPPTPAEDVIDDYDLVEITAPVVTGTPLMLFTAVAESALYPPLLGRLLRNNGVPQVLEESAIPERALCVPNTDGWAAEGARDGEVVCGQDVQAQQVVTAAARLLGLAHDEARAAAQGEAIPTSLAAAMHAAFVGGRATPSQVAERVIAGIAESEAAIPPMRFLIGHDPRAVRVQAAASTERYRAGRPLSLIDGVPFAVKDEVDVDGFDTTSGTAFLAKCRPATGTLPGVDALLAAGAVLVGKTTMHEIGLGTTGLNVVTGTARNPHDTARHTGGSSSGTAAIVAAGLCAFAVGGDGGGSIRIPAAFCGCVGLKPTYNRACPYPRPSLGHSVGVVGPIAHSVRDAALMYSLLGNRGHGQHGMDAPPRPLTLPDLSLRAVSSGTALEGKIAGIHWAWFEHCDPGVADACKRAVALLEARGLKVEGIVVPELKACSVAHSVTISSEMRSGMAAHLRDGATRRSLNAETRVSLATAAGFSGAWYVSAQKIRRRMDAHFRRLFAKLDFIITPTVPVPAPAIRPAALACGESDLGTTTRLMRYVQPANFVGFPAISVPVGSVLAAPDAGRGVGNGSGSARLPVGLQLMAAPWHEAALLHAGAVLEAALGAEARPRPAVYWDLLQQQE